MRDCWCLRASYSFAFACLPSSSSSSSMSMALSDARRRRRRLWLTDCVLDSHSFRAMWKIKMAVNISISERYRWKITVWQCFWANSSPKVGAVVGHLPGGHRSGKILWIWPVESGLLKVWKILLGWCLVFWRKLFLILWSDLSNIYWTSYTN